MQEEGQDEEVDKNTNNKRKHGATTHWRADTPSHERERQAQEGKHKKHQKQMKEKQKKTRPEAPKPGQMKGTWETKER